ncbi:hypothetical protein CIT292_09565 [Citrobacter youngae ATCC 29220]|uniref:Uncharacterized protein n=1 Tax=Citrobacter youngae ATCC 29220 TaxID=500640 RepID=D4BGB9_9ENTR|nr:hypothetical protein CIT292_09565 [Citrobacter youngae ATCC 29220]
MILTGAARGAFGFSGSTLGGVAVLWAGSTGDLLNIEQPLNMSATKQIGKARIIFPQ